MDLHEKMLRTAGIRDYPVGTGGDLIVFSLTRWRSQGNQIEIAAHHECPEPAICYIRSQQRAHECPEPAFRYIRSQWRATRDSILAPKTVFPSPVRQASPRRYPAGELRCASGSFRDITTPQTAEC